MSIPTNGRSELQSRALAAGLMYSVRPATDNHPMNYINWYDAIRFANWMDNGQPVFTTEPTATNNATESGSYTLVGFTADPEQWQQRRAQCRERQIVLPSENEWYKAAYYDPYTSSYYLYPTSSNSTPNSGYPTATPNSANFYPDGPDDLTDVGAYSGTTSFTVRTIWRAMFGSGTSR